MKPPCVVVVQYVLPAIRVVVARELIEKHGLKRIEVAEKMEMTPAAITQYLKKVRGGVGVNTVKSSERAIKILSEITDGLVKDEATVHEILGKICEACRVIMSEGLICTMHKEVMPVLERSEVCECPVCH